MSEDFELKHDERGLTITGNVDKFIEWLKEYYEEITGEEYEEEPDLAELGQHRAEEREGYDDR